MSLWKGSIDKLEECRKRMQGYTPEQRQDLQDAYEEKINSSSGEHQKSLGQINYESGITGITFWHRLTPECKSSFETRAQAVAHEATKDLEEKLTSALALIEKMEKQVVLVDDALGAYGIGRLMSVRQHTIPEILIACKKFKEGLK